MAILEIELNIDQHRSSYFKVAPTLSGQVYELTFKWSVRSEAWYLDIGDAVKGIKVVTGIDLLGPYHYMEDKIPAGKLGARRNTGRASKPGFFNFGIGKEIALIYEEP